MSLNPKKGLEVLKKAGNTSMIQSPLPKLSFLRCSVLDFHFLTDLYADMLECDSLSYNSCKKRKRPEEDLAVNATSSNPRLSIDSIHVRSNNSNKGTKRKSKSLE